MKRLLILIPLVLSGCINRTWDQANWIQVQSPTRASLRGLHVIEDTVAWASGTGGTWMRSTDGGLSWQGGTIETARDLDFRDIHGFDADSAVVLSAGLPARIYRTDDAGATWNLCYEDTTEGIFFDAMDFWDEARGIAFSDPVDGKLVIIRTSDGGRSWSAVPTEGVPDALDGEAGFAASGTCLAATHPRSAWIGLGGPAARLFHTTNGGDTWNAGETAMIHGESSGIFSLAFRNQNHGVAVGGNYLEPDSNERSSLWTNTAGASWQLSEVPPSGYRSGVANVPGSDVYIAVGTNGMDVSLDGGRTWRPLGSTGYHAVAVSDNGRALAVGAQGRTAFRSPR